MMEYAVYTDEVDKDEAGNVKRSYIKERIVKGMNNVEKMQKEGNVLTVIPLPRGIR